MRWVKSIVGLFHRRRQELELEAELRFHLEAQVEESIRRGVAPEEARRQAMLDLNGIESVKESCREERPGMFLETVWRDIRFGSRMLRKSPGFAALAVFSLAVGLGASALLFSLADTALLKPLPFPSPERLVEMLDVNPEQSIARIGVTTGNVADWRERNRTLSGVAAWYVMGRTLRLEESAEVVRTAQVSADFFSVFPLRPALGRVFTEAETSSALFNSAAAPVGPDPVVLISHRLWTSRFHNDPDILQRKLSIERKTWRVVGVVPDAFDVLHGKVDLYIPWGFGDRSPRDQHYVRAVARLKPGVTLEQASADMSSVAAALGREHPDTNRGWDVELAPLREEIAGGARQVLLVLLCGVGFVLLLACVNIATLQMVRGSARDRETALRLALGASRARLLRQHLTESALLVAAGSAAGVMLATGSLRMLQSWQVESIPRLSEASIDLRTLGFLVAAAAFAGLASGLSPALAGLKVGLQGSLNEAVRSTTGRARRRWQDKLVAAELAIAAILAVGAGLLVRSYSALIAVDPGFKPDNVLVLPVFLDNLQYDSGAKTRAYYDALTRRLSDLPGVEAVGGATALPASPLGPDFERPVWASERPPASNEAHQADVRIVTPGYFKTLRIGVVRGRSFSETDGPQSPLVLMVNEKLARQLWPAEDPIGKKLVVDYSTGGTYPYEVVGVVNDVRFRGLRSESRPEIYMPHAQRSYLVMNMAVRSAGPPEALVNAVRQALRDVDPMQPAHSITPLWDLVGATVARDRFAVQTLLAFAGAALLLAVVGVYGVLSHSVQQRVPEIGVRMALGARPGHIRWMILGKGARLIAVGLALGIGCAIGLAHLMRGLLFGVAPDDPFTLAGAAGLLLLTALAAACLPARRAVRVDPLVALRHE